MLDFSSILITNEHTNVFVLNTLCVTYFVTSSVVWSCDMAIYTSWVRNCYEITN